MSKDEDYPTIIIFEEKHGSRYFIAHNNKEVGQIALKVIADRLEEGYWYDDDEDCRIARQEEWNAYRTATEKLTPKEIKDLGIKKPEYKEPPSLNNIAKDFYRQIEWQAETLAKKIVADKDGEAAYKFLYYRSDGEYERMLVESPEAI